MSQSVDEIELIDRSSRTLGSDVDSNNGPTMVEDQESPGDASESKSLMADEFFQLSNTSIY
jgi:hypothetical protein